MGPTLCLFKPAVVGHTSQRNGLAGVDAYIGHPVTARKYSTARQAGGCSTSDQTPVRGGKALQRAAARARPVTVAAELVCLRTGLLLLALEQRQQRHTRHLHDLQCSIRGMEGSMCANTMATHQPNHSFPYQTIRPQPHSGDPRVRCTQPLQHSLISHKHAVRVRATQFPPQPHPPPALAAPMTAAFLAHTHCCAP
jgi:hypothetical protein